ncbi:phloem protein 2-like protein, partial [Tanacetum coccineum]
MFSTGASGKIYKGELSIFKKSIPVAVKRLDRVRSYDEGAFFIEVVKLYRYVHENIITRRGFCEEEYENIIIMDYAINESLDKHLNNSSLTWSHRLNISIGAAKGLHYIYSFEEDQKPVHGDIKSGNILLDHDWKATIFDFIVSKSHGTLGYLDPQYSSNGATKETDVYSFGVVLFELLSGRPTIDKVEKYSHPILRQIIDVGDGVKDKKVVFLTWMAARCFEERKLHALIFDDIKEQTDIKSIDILSKSAYDCLQKDPEKRLMMDLVIHELEKALNIYNKMHFLLSSMSVVYVLTTPIPDDGDDAIVDQLRNRAKWDNNDYVCRGLILNGLFDSLFDIYQNVESSKELWNSLKAKYMAEDASSKKFLDSNFT